MTPLVLRLPDFNQHFVIECDACGLRIGAGLSQNNQPIAYYSEALEGSTLSLSTYEKEMLALVKSVQKWRSYLLWKPFTVRTNQQNLKFLLEQQVTTPTQPQWLSKLLSYEYVIEYKKGLKNKAVDFISRIVEFQMMMISMPRVEWWKKLQSETQRDPYYTHLADTSSNDKFILRNGVWFKEGKIVSSPH